MQNDLQFNQDISILFSKNTNEQERINSIKRIIKDDLGVELLKRLVIDNSELENIRIQAIIELIINQKITLIWIKDFLEQLNSNNFTVCLLNNLLNVDSDIVDELLNLYHNHHDLYIRKVSLNLSKNRIEHNINNIKERTNLERKVLDREINFVQTLKDDILSLRKKIEEMEIQCSKKELYIQELKDKLYQKELEDKELLNSLQTKLENILNAISDPINLTEEEKLELEKKEKEKQYQRERSVTRQKAQEILSKSSIMGDNEYW